MAVLGLNTLNHSNDLFIQRAGTTRINVTSTGLILRGNVRCNEDFDVSDTATFSGDLIASTGTTGSLKLGNPATNFPANDTSGQGVVYDAESKRLSMMAASDIVLNVGRRGTDGPCTRFFKSGNAVGNIQLTDSSTSYTTSSDYRIKENVIPLTSAIDRLNQMKVYRFNFISDPNTVVDGFIAHEAQEVVPECVTGVKDEVDENGDPVYQGIDQSKIVPLLTAALQEALVEIKNLKDRVIDLENI
jgi:hypothetical protein